MIGVIVESNWVYEYCAPAHRRTKDAQSLVARAAAGEILGRVLELRQVPDVAVLRPFDESILAAVLVKGERFRDAGFGDVRFCCLDQDLRPWTKRGEPKPGLRDLYARAGIQFVDDLAVSRHRA